MLMGIYLFPYLKLPALTVEGNLGVLAILASVTSLAAIGYGISIGTIARTHTQASVFASISVVILAALGGVWVPVFIMPPFLREISVASPLNWGLNGFYDVFIRSASFTEILPNIAGLLLFSIACIAVAVFYKKRVAQL